MTKPGSFAVVSLLALACAALPAQGEPMATLREDLAALGDPRHREHALLRLVERGEEAALPLARLVSGGDPTDPFRIGPDRATRRAALRALMLLGGRGKAAMPALETALATPAAPGADAPARRMAIDRPGISAATTPLNLLRADLTLALACLRLPGEPETQFALVAGSGDLTVRTAAAFALGERGTEAALALPALLDLERALSLRRQAPLGAANDVLDEVALRSLLREVVLSAIAAIDPDHERALEGHLTRLGSVRQSERLAAIQALGRRGEGAAAAVPRLAAMAAEADPVLAREAVTALGMIGIESVATRRVLMMLSKREDRQLATRAAAALAQLDAKRAGK